MKKSASKVYIKNGELSGKRIRRTSVRVYSIQSVHEDNAIQ